MEEKWNTHLLCKPSQVRPFPVYPDWQLHKKLPIELVQLALSSQGNVALEHSSTSVFRRDNNFNKCKKIFNTVLNTFMCTCELIFRIHTHHHR